MTPSSRSALAGIVLAFAFAVLTACGREPSAPERQDPPSGSAADTAARPDAGNPFPIVVAGDESRLPAQLRAAYLEDAGILAVRALERLGPLEEQPVELPAQPRLSLFNALVHVFNATGPARDSMVGLYGVHALPRPQTRSFLIKVDTTVAWTGAWRGGKRFTGEPEIDALLEAHSLTLAKYYDWSFGDYARLDGSRPLNPEALLAKFRPIKGILSAQVNNIFGDGRDITAEPVGGAWKLEFMVGYGDCIAGCIHRHFWTFSVDRAGRVQHLGSHGDPLPPPDKLN